jgi:hypothetical protein
MQHSTLKGLDMAQLIVIASEHISLVPVLRKMPKLVYGLYLLKAVTPHGVRRCWLNNSCRDFVGLVMYTAAALLCS